MLPFEFEGSLQPRGCFWTDSNLFVCTLAPKDRKDMSWGASYQNSSQDISFCVLVKRKLSVLWTFLVSLEGLDVLDLLGLTAFASVAWFLEGFWLVLLRLRFAGWRVLDFHMVAELVCLELSEKWSRDNAVRTRAAAARTLWKGKATK